MIIGDREDGGGGLGLARWKAMRRNLKRWLRRDRLGSIADKSGCSSIQPVPNGLSTMPHSPAMILLVVRAVSMTGQVGNRIPCFDYIFFEFLN